MTAEALREWLPSVLQALDPWMSAEDIDKGALWGSNIAEELTKSTAGIICITAENLEAPWLHFEAGALSKAVERSLVCPYLIGLRPNELRGPLVQFQATVAEKKDTLKLLNTLNSALGKALPGKQLEKAFEDCWPKFESTLQVIRSTDIAPIHSSSGAVKLNAFSRLLRRVLEIGEHTVAALASILSVRLIQEVLKYLTQSANGPDIFDILPVGYVIGCLYLAVLLRFVWNLATKVGQKP